MVAQWWIEHMSNFMLGPEARREIASWSPTTRIQKLMYYREQATEMKAEMLTIPYGCPDWWELRRHAHLCILICCEITNNCAIPHFVYRHGYKKQEQFINVLTSA